MSEYIEYTVVDELNKKINERDTVISELKARVARLEEFITSSIYDASPQLKMRGELTLDESPAQSLALHDADIIEVFGAELKGDDWKDKGLSSFVKVYADNLRNSVNGCESRAIHKSHSSFDASAK